MRTRLLICMVLHGAIGCGLFLRVQELAAGQGPTVASADSSSQVNASAAAQTPQTATKLDEIIDRIIKREHDEIAAFDLFSPVIETYIQEVKFKQAFGTVPKSDRYFLGQADFQGRLKVHSMIEGGKKRSFFWSFDPAGFLQMI